MTYLPSQFGFLPRPIFGLYGPIGKSVEPQASLPSKAVRPPFHSDEKGGEKILCNPPSNPAETPPAKPFRKKIWVLTYILSEHKRRKE